AWKAQMRPVYYRPPHAEGRLYEEGGVHEREQVVGDDPAGARAERLGRVYELAPTERGDLGSHEPFVARPAEEAEREDGVPDTRSEHGGERDREQEPGKG